MANRFGRNKRRKLIAKAADLNATNNDLLKSNENLHFRIRDAADNAAHQLGKRIGESYADPNFFFKVVMDEMQGTLAKNLGEKIAYEMMKNYEIIKASNYLASSAVKAAQWSGRSSEIAEKTITTITVSIPPLRQSFRIA